MFLFIERLAEEAIRKAQEEGQFDDLPGKGRPLPEEDLSMVPPELRMAYRILKNAGCLPPELESEREIHNAIEMLSGLADEQERYRQMQKLNLLIRKLNMSRRRPIDLEMQELYYDKVVERVSVAKKDRP